MKGLVSAHIRSNVVGYVALFFALTGASYAAVAANSIKSKQIKDGEVKEQDLGGDAVTSAKLADEAVIAGKLSVDVVDGQNVVDSSLGGADILEENLDSSILQMRIGADCSAGQLVRGVDADGTLDCANGGGTPSGSAGGDLAGTYPSPTIGSNAVGTAEVDSSLTASDIADTSSIGTAEINEANLFNDNSLTGGDIADIPTGIETCHPSSLVLPFGRLCAGGDGVDRGWYAATKFCTDLGLRLASVGDALYLADNFSLSSIGVGVGERFWTDGYYFNSGAGNFFATSITKQTGDPDAGGDLVSSTINTICVAIPSA